MTKGSAKDSLSISVFTKISVTKGSTKYFPTVK